MFRATESVIADFQSVMWSFGSFLWRLVVKLVYKICRNKVLEKAQTYEKQLETTPCI